MVTTLPGTPAADGFAMPAERDRHEGCWLAWPENGYAWRLGARPAQRAVATLANAIADTGEQVTVTVSDAQYANARSTLDGRVRVVEMASWLAWARDVAPTFVLDASGRRRGVDFGFDGYRRRYPYWQVDARYTGKVLDLTGTDRYRAPLITEGGAFHVDGDGTCLVTAEAMVDRNPRLSRAEIDAALGDHLGVRTVLWIEHGLLGDPTAHIDNVAAFVEPGVVVVAWTDDPTDPQHDRCAQALDVLKNASIRAEKLPLPRPRYPTDEELDGLDRTPAGSLPPTRIPASYCNYYLANGHVLMPLLDPETDTEAVAILSRLYPDRTVVPLDTRELLLGGGNIHCATQQVPAVSNGRR